VAIRSEREPGRQQLAKRSGAVLAFIVVTLVVPFMRKVASPAAPSADGHWES
jgi:hypothetical protein